MGAGRRLPVRVFDKLPLAASSSLDDCPAIAIGVGGHLSLDVLVSNAALGAPTDSPKGVWEVWTTSVGANAAAADYSQVLDLGDGKFTTAITALSPQGNNALLKAGVSLRGLRGMYAKVRYNYTSGGTAGNLTAAASRARVIATVDETNG